MTRKIPIWVWPVGLIGGYFGVKHLWAKAENPVKSAPLSVRKNVSEVAAETAKAGARFMTMIATSMADVAYLLALSTSAILGMEQGFGITQVDEGFFNGLNVNQVNSEFDLLADKAKKQGYITSEDFRSIVNFMMHEKDFKTFSKSYHNVAPGSFAKILALYGNVKDGSTPFFASYDSAIGEIAVKARTNKSITGEQYHGLATAISNGRHSQDTQKSNDTGLIVITQAGLNLAGDLNAAIEAGDITVE